MTVNNIFSLGNSRKILSPLTQQPVFNVYILLLLLMFGNDVEQVEKMKNKILRDSTAVALLARASLI
jgi:hypothetical protein